MAQKPLTRTEISSMAKTWYRKLDVHAPLIDILPMLAARGLEMKFPEATLRGLAAFEGWYEGVIRIFFDEVHRVKSVKPVLRGERAKVKVVVRWEASRWRAPAPKSDRIVLDAYQTWVVQRSKNTGKPEIVTYSVDKLKYAKGSARL